MVTRRILPCIYNIQNIIYCFLQWNFCRKKKLYVPKYVIFIKYNITNRGQKVINEFVPKYKITAENCYAVSLLSLIYFVTRYYSTELFCCCVFYFIIKEGSGDGYAQHKKQIYYCNVNEARFKDGMHNKRIFFLNHYTLEHTQLLYCIYGGVYK